MGYQVKVDLTKVGEILPAFNVEKRNTAKIIKSTLENAGATVTVEQNRTVDFIPRKKVEKKGVKTESKKK